MVFFVFSVIHKTSFFVYCSIPYITQKVNNNGSYTYKFRFIGMFAMMCIPYLPL